MRRYAILAVLALAGAVCGAQPLQWPVDHSRNPAMEVRDLPSELSEENLVWEFDVRGGSQFAMPVIAGDRLLLGSTQRSLLHDELARLNREQSGGALICLDRLTGDLEWELLAPGLGSIGSYGMYGICNTPLVESNRAYFVDPLGNLLCLDMNGQADGNDGPFTDELAYMANTGCHILKDRVLEDPPPAEMKSKYGDIIWRFEFLERFQLAWKHAFSGTMIIDGDLIYLPTTSATRAEARRMGTPEARNAPTSWCWIRTPAGLSPTIPPMCAAWITASGERRAWASSTERKCFCSAMAGASCTPSALWSPRTYGRTKWLSWRRSGVSTAFPPRTAPEATASSNTPIATAAAMRRPARSP